jgi:hypothetical protein
MENDLKSILISAGWYEGRNTGAQLEDTPVYRIVPQSVISFVTEFGSLKINNDKALDQVEVVGADYFNSLEVYNYIKLNSFNNSDRIDTTNENDEYYYSALIGKQIYFVARLKEGNNLMMDEDANFYILTFIPEFIWIAKKAEVAIHRILFGFNAPLLLNEQTLKWVPSVGEKLSYDPPLNDTLQSNPWGR